MDRKSEFDGIADVTMGPNGEFEAPCECSGSYGPAPEGATEPGESLRGIGIIESAYDESLRRGVTIEEQLEG